MKSINSFTWNSNSAASDHWHKCILCHTLGRLGLGLGFTRKKLKYVALQCSDVLRAGYQSEVSLFDPIMLVFVDESGYDARNASRKYGYSLQGFPAKNFRFVSRGKRLSAIGALTSTSLLDCYIVEGTVNGGVFYDFVLLPHLQPFNGINPNSSCFGQLLHPPCE